MSTEYKAFIALLPSYLADQVKADTLTPNDAAEAMGYSDAMLWKPYNNRWSWRTEFGAAYKRGYNLAIENEE